MQTYQTVSLSHLQDADEGFFCRFLANYDRVDMKSMMVIAKRDGNSIFIGLESIELNGLRKETLYEWMGIVRRPSELQQEDNNWPPLYVQATICRDATLLDTKLREEVDILKADFLARFMSGD